MADTVESEKVEQISVILRKKQDVVNWQKAAKALGYSSPVECLRYLAEEARVLKMTKHEQSETSPVTAAA